MFDLTTLVLLGLVGLAAGFVDAVAGGGGMIGVPALLAFGVPPVGALATNKVQGIVGTTIAAITFWRRGLVSLKALALPIILTFAGSFVGALAVTRLDTSALEALIPLAVIGVALYFGLAPSAGDLDRKARLSFALGVPVMSVIVGFYDGAFGPGTGSFFLLGFVALFGFGLTRALANTKVLNVTSNAAALAFFIPAGAVVWPVALVMAVGQVAGGYIGARTSLRYGARVIRPLVILVAIVLALRLLFFR